MRVMVAVLGLGLAACGAEPGVPLDRTDAGPDDDAGSDAASDAGGEDPLDPTTFGPYPVGVVTVELTDASRERTLPVEIWYPADLDAGAGTPNVYDLGSIGELATAAMRDAAPATGNFPLVLFSHGFGGIRFQSFFMTEHLASHGYVVAAPDHVGNTITDLGSLGDEEAIAQSAIDRPLDLVFVLERLLAGEAGVDVLIDPARIATSGHSFGGWTSLETARQDDRIAAVFSLAPGFRETSTPADVAEIGRPIALFGGSEDGTTPFDTDQQPAYEAAAPPKLLVEVMGAGHLDFSDLCEIPEMAAIVDDGCDPTLIDPALVRSIVATVSVPWLGRYLLGDERWEPWLEDAALRALGPVEVWSAY
jgi:predicted dienelactone hydrolase